MAPTTRASARWAASRVTALPEFWGLVAEHSGLAGAWRLTGVCRASRVGAKEWLRTLRRLVVCGGHVTGGEGCTREVWRLNLGELRWERMSAPWEQSRRPCVLRREGGRRSARWGKQ